MDTVMHHSETRGHANHGWLDSYHTFSFGRYHNPERMNFGALRVLNDDRVAPGQGFGTHPHDNMEIVSIPLEGDLEHQDSMGNKTVIREGDVQVMSAGTGIFHSEYNANADKEVKFLQIWIIPNARNVEPRYDQISLRDLEEKNRFFQVLSPHRDEQGVWIYQDAWFHMGHFETGREDSYKLKKQGNGLYVFMLEGEAEMNGQHLAPRDGLGIWNEHEFQFKTTTPARVLLLEVPLESYT
jgi:redox-sensitive bicupin YhaK (pirin superfamily)